jgi:capsular polysaccharide biosynthesis protein/GGDEF domain-containing protein
VELRRYFRVLQRRRRIGATAFLVTSVATFFLVLMQPAVYESRGTALLQPRLSGTEGDAIDASDLLVRGVKIAETYATVARSDHLRELAEASVDPAIDLSGITVGAEVVTDTNILSISARGKDPEAVQALSTAVMDSTVGYVSSLDEPYVISTLDEPKVGKDPVGPNKGVTIAIGVIFGMVLAVILALFAEYLGGGIGAEGISVDERTGLYNETYLRTRVREEMSRADRTGRSFSLAAFLVAIQQAGDEPWRPPSDLDLQRIGELLPLTVREEVVIAHLGDGEFGALLPDMERPAADRTLARWEAGVSAVLDGHHQTSEFTPGFAEGVSQYRDQAFDGDREAIRLARRLTDREAPTVVRARPRVSPGPPPTAPHEPRSKDNGSRADATGEPAVPIDPATSAVGPGRPIAPARQGGNQRSKASKGKPRAANRRR